ncbi:GGDEF domain-containing protein [Neptunomonas phycophila]|uniref:GGDEF domain-containing protein n=1 Tax=Neptunomonas phycophila TaxID=1572645 RepID=UPI0026E2C24F|nr:GGDEF domain-containing protein [Neptunomonas phycophila]MDO6469939.1 GGDEF domain-containing protein [Neptunomonas phycophila]
MAILLKLRLVLGLLLALGYSTIVMAETSKSILIINSWSEQLPWQQSIERGFLQAMDAEPNTIVYTEHLDAERFPTEDYQDVFAAYLTQKYKSIELESVVAESLPAVEFLMKNQSLFTNIHRFYFPDSDKVTATLSSDESLIPIFEDYLGSFNEMLRIYNPDNIYVVADSLSYSGRNQLQRFKEALPTSLLNDPITYLVDKPMTELVEEVSRLPENSAIFYLLIFRDGAGKDFIPYKAAQRISEAANAPVFSVWESLMGSGVVGGYLLSGERVGNLAGNAALYFGQQPLPTTKDAFEYYYDVNQIERFGINKKDLPDTTILINDFPSFYESYKLQINLTLLALTLFIVLSIILSVVNRKRRYLVNALQTEQDLLEKRVFERTQELNQLRIKAEKDARTDVLTQLNNRRAFFELGSLIHSQSVRYKRSYAILVMDVDLFKQVNDTYGHDAGDVALKRLAHVMHASLRSSDIMARIGGEEFAAIITDLSNNNVLHKAEHLRASLEKEEITWKAHSFSITMSIGVAYYSPNDKGISDVLKRADQALYNAKGHGRNQVIDTSN